MKTTDPAPKIAIIIPAYNESASIGQVVRKLKTALISQKFNFALVVVDDGSTDDTAARAEQAGAYVIRHLLNVGTGGATTTGLSFALNHGFAIAATLDADGQHDSGDVITGIELMTNSEDDLLIGSRLMQRGVMPPSKLVGNRGLSWITYVLCGVRITDSQSGLRVFSTRALQALRWKTNHYGFCSEMLWRAKQQGLVIKEYPIKTIYTEYSLSKGQSNWNAITIIKSLLGRRIMDLFSE